MNGQHLRAFLWLRWRIRLNQLKRGGTANVVILAILTALGAVLAVGLFVGLFLVGLFVLPEAPPQVVLYVWDGLVLAFFFWATGLLMDLQRAEALSLDKFLHLPVSLKGAFLINYLSSLFSVNLILFVPAMVGLGLAFDRGPALLMQLPVLAAFLLMVTALTYQFQGWLAALMANKRRRRTVIVVVTAALVVLMQLPNLLNVMQPWQGAGNFRSREQARQALEQIERTIRFVNLVLPPGWLPLGAQAAAEGDVPGVLLATLGLTLIGAGSLWRAYRTTVRLYTGHFTSGKRRAAPAAPLPPAGQRPAGLLEKQLPGVSEQAAVIALGGLRSLLRAPEAKMLLLPPVIMVVIFGGLFLRGPMDLPEMARPLIAFGAMAMVLIPMGQLAGNQFGFDRNGFRVFVLSPASRRDVLLGKNLALAPLVLGLCAVVVALVVALYPMRLDHVAALLPQMLSMYLVFCVLANWLSIMAPVRIAAGTLKPSNSNLVTVLLQLGFGLLLPFALAPTLLPLGIEFLLESRGWDAGVPVCLLLSAGECLAIVWLYRWALNGQGHLLQAREQRILKVVTTRAE
jgi:hypothetical protein